MSSSRRNFVKNMALGAGFSALPTSLHSKHKGYASSDKVNPRDRKLLFVITASGGASIIDSFMPVVKTASSPHQLNAYPEQLVQSHNSFKCIKDIPYRLKVPVGPNYSQLDFLKKNSQDMTIIPHNVTSVNHFIAAERSLTGNAAYKKRTVLEMAAEKHGAGLVFPHVVVASGGYASQGHDLSLPSYARAQLIGETGLFSFSTHGSQGLENADSQLFQRARRVRDHYTKISPFSKKYRNSSLLRNFRQFRSKIPEIEALDLMDKLTLIDHLPNGKRVQDYGIRTTPLLDTLLENFPHLLDDELQGRVALGFLLAYYGMSSAVCMSMPSTVKIIGQDDTERMINLPLGFDWSHNAHRAAQNTMWRRVLQTTDALVGLLKATPYLGEEENGSMWDRSMIYIATEFGRGKNLTNPERSGSVHDLNNGSILLSPFLKKGIFGGVDEKTGRTYGANPQTGDSDPETQLSERHIFSLICQGLGVDFDGSEDMSKFLI